MKIGDWVEPKKTASPLLVGYYEVVGFPSTEEVYVKTVVGNSGVKRVLISDVEALSDEDKFVVSSVLKIALNGISLANQVRRSNFMGELQALLKKYDAEISAESDKSQVYLTLKMEGKVLASFSGGEAFINGGRV
jgi:hypothetical protein